MRLLTWRRRRYVFILTISLTFVLVVVGITVSRHWLPVHVHHHTNAISPTETMTLRLTQSIRPRVHTTQSSVISRTVRLGIGDVAVLLGRLQNTTAESDSKNQSHQTVMQRVSRQLNDALRVFQQDRCRTPGVDFTDTGAWCQRAVRDLHIVDTQLAYTLAEFLAGASVLSLGDGTGFYKEVILNTSKVCIRHHRSDFNARQHAERAICYRPSVR